jgi:NADPH:quinone reductase-like Zn-dependent oxidoreductase
MKAIALADYGAPLDVLELKDVAEPAVGESEVLVRVHAASVNPADWHVMRGEPRIARLSFGLRGPT